MALDPQAYNLARAIRRTETGTTTNPYNAKGASGEFGAYQFMPATYKALAKKYLGDENAAPTVENQNKLAYSEIKALKDAGKTPAQIASIWNSGKADAYKTATTGVNKMGVAYDVPAYVAKVSAAYNELKGSQQVQPAEQPTPTEQPQPEQKKDGLLASLIKAPIKSLLVKPADRFAEAVGRTGILGKDIKQGYEMMADEGQGRTYGGITVEPQKGGVAGLKQVAGDAAEAASYLYGGAAAPKIAKAGLKGKILTSGLQGAKTGAISGGALGFGDSIRQEGSSLGSVTGGTLGGAALGGITGGALGGATPLVAKGVNQVVNRTAIRQAKIAKEFDNAVGQVLQGETKDLKIGKDVLSKLDTEDIKTYKDLSERANEKIEILSNKLDEVLETNPNPKILDNLALETKVGSQTIKQNYVTEALDQLENFYEKTNDLAGKARIQQIRKKAQIQGLSVKEVNDIARLHGKSLSAYNLNGELASGLTKQAAENTRSGLKATARENFGEKISKEADAEIAKLIRVRDLANEMVEKVNALQQKVKERGFGEEVGRRIAQIVDLVSLGSIGGATRSLLVPRGVGLKVLNALDLEKNLSKNLKLIKEATIPEATEQTVLKNLEQVLKNAGQKPALLKLPAPGQTSKQTIKLPAQTLSSKDQAERLRLSKN